MTQPGYTGRAKEPRPRALLTVLLFYAKSGAEHMHSGSYFSAYLHFLNEWYVPPGIKSGTSKPFKATF